MNVRGKWIVAAGLLLAGWGGLRAQGPPPGPVRYTEAVEVPVRQAIELTGSVESLSESVIASEVAGLVDAVDVVAGQHVRRGQRLARLRTDLRRIELEAASSSLVVARAQLELAESQVKRTRELFDKGVVSQREMDDSARELNQRRGEVAVADAVERRVRYQLDRSKIVAPFTGVVVRKRTEVGQWIADGGPVVELLSLDPLEVVVRVPEQYFGQLDTGASASVRIEALPGETIAGTVERVVPRADPQARTFDVRVRMANPEMRVAVGMLAQVSMSLGRVADGLLVPKDAVIRRGGSEHLFRVGADGTVERVDVTSLRGHGGWLEVRRGPIQPGDRVIIRGNERLRPGQQVVAEPLDVELPPAVQR